MVIQIIADAIDCTAACQNKIFDIRIQSVRVGCFDRIVTLASVLNDRICSVIDDKQIISRTTDQGVGTCATIEHVISCTAHQNIIGAVSYQCGGGRGAGAGGGGGAGGRRGGGGGAGRI